MKGYFSKKLNNSALYSELQDNLKMYYEHSIKKETKQQSYLDRVYFKNAKTNEVLQTYHDFEKQYKSYATTTQQRVYTIEHLANRKEFSSVFITLTLPSVYHPFRSIKTKKGRLYVAENKEFAFPTIKEAVSEGYQLLNHMYQTFYKRIKNYTKDNLYYIKCIENHSTMIPHLHMVLYFPQEFYSQIRQAFSKLMDDFSINGDFEDVQFKDELTYASNYLLKYITKNLVSGADYFQARVLDGWKRYHKIRVMSSSVLPLKIGVYKKIYSSIKRNEKLLEKKWINFLECDKIDFKNEEINIKNIAISKGIPIYLLIQDNLNLSHSIKSKTQEKVIKFKSGNMIQVDIKHIKTTKSYLVKDFQISIGGVVVYNNDKYIKHYLY